MIFLIKLLVFLTNFTFALFPPPQNISAGDAVLGLDKHFRIVVSKNQAITENPKLFRMVGEVAQQYEEVILKNKYEIFVTSHLDSSVPETTISKLFVTVLEKGLSLNSSTDESYSLYVPANSPIASLTGKTYFGLVRGLETFSQLVYYSDAKKMHVLMHAPLNITDYPKYSYRGLLLDTSRNYFPVESILRIIDVMSWSKFNVFHWHIVDSQSFPMKLESMPELAEKGAYSPDMVYSKSDVKKVIKYAYKRGIRVIPEFDMPGHTFAIALSHPELMACVDVQPNWQDYAAEPPSGQLIITKPEVYDLAHKAINEMAIWFEDDVVHLGGDETNKKCWTDNPAVQGYLKDHPSESVESLVTNFTLAVHNFARSNGRTPMIWEDAIVIEHMPVGKDALVQVWTNSTKVKQIAEKGYSIIASSADHWYLDCGYGEWIGNQPDGSKSWCDPYKSWQTIYLYNLVDGIEDEEQRKLIKGGELCLWSEQADENDVESKLWPRAAAGMGVLWSGNVKEGTSGSQVKSTKPIVALMNEFHERLISRGVRASPLQPRWCWNREGHCDA